MFRSEDLKISDPLEVANRFYNYFSSIGPNLAKAIQLPSFLHKDFLSGSFQVSMFFNPTTKDEIITIAQSLASCKATGFDNIPMSIIKVSANLFGLEFCKILKSYHNIAHYIYFVLKKNYLKTFFSCGVITNFVFCVTKMLIRQGVMRCRHSPTP